MPPPNPPAAPPAGPPPPPVGLPVDELSEQLKLIQQLTLAMLELTKVQQLSGNVMGRQRDGISEVGSSFKDLEAALEKSRKAGDNWREDIKKQIVNIESFSDAASLAGKALKHLAKENKKLGDALAFGAGAAKGLSATFSFLKAAATGVIGVVTSVIGAVLDLGAAILSAPFKMLEGLISMAKEGMGSTELAQAGENIRETFGDLSKGAGKSVSDLGQSLTHGMIAPGLSAIRVFGTLAEAMEYANKVASVAPVLFTSMRGEFEKNGQAVLAMAKGLGIADEDFAGLMSSARATGQTVESIEVDIAKHAKGLSAEFGLNSKLMSRDIGRALKDVKHFANSTVKEIAKATAYAHGLGLELKDITGILDAFNTFDQAAENVSKLSQAFGVNLDTMKLLEAKTPADALKLVKDSFNAAGKSVENMNRQEIQLIAASVGMTEENVRQGFSSKNLGISYNKVATTSESLEKQTLSTSKALSMMSEDIVRAVKAGPTPESNTLWGIFFEGFLIGVRRTKEFQHVLNNLRKDINLVKQAGAELGPIFVASFPGVKDMLEGLAGVLSPDKIGGLFNSFKNTFADFFKLLKDGKGTVQGLFAMLQGNLTKYLEAAGPDGQKLLAGLQDFWNALKAIIVSGIDWLGDQMKRAFESIIEMIDGDDKGMGKVLSAVQREASPIISAFGGLFEKIKEPLKTLIKKFFSYFGDVISDIWKEHWGKILLVTIGPSILSGFTSLLGSRLLQAGITRAIGAAVAGSAAAAATTAAATAATTAAATAATTAAATTAASYAAPAMVTAGQAAIAATGAAPALVTSAATASGAAAVTAGSAPIVGAAGVVVGSTVAAVAGAALAVIGSAALVWKASVMDVRQDGATQEYIDKISKEFQTVSLNINNDIASGTKASLEDAMAKSSKFDNDLNEQIKKIEANKNTFWFNEEANDQIKNLAAQREGLFSGRIEIIKQLAETSTPSGKLKDVLRKQKDRLTDAKFSLMDDIREANPGLNKKEFQELLDKNSDYTNVTNEIKRIQEKVTITSDNEISPSVAANKAKKGEEERNKLIAEGDAANKRTIAALGETTVDNVEARIQQILAVGKKVSGSKVEFNKNMDAIRDDLATMNFSLFKSPADADKFNESVGRMQQVITFINTIKGAIASLSDISKVVENFGTIATKGSIVGRFHTSMATLVNGWSDVKVILFGGTTQAGVAVTNSFASIDVSNDNQAVLTAKNVAFKAFSTSMGEIAKSMTDVNKALDDVIKTSGSIKTNTAALSSVLAAKGATMPSFSDITKLVDQLKIEEDVTPLTKKSDYLKTVRRALRSAAKSVNVINTAITDLLKEYGSIEAQSSKIKEKAGNKNPLVSLGDVSRLLEGITGSPEKANANASAAAAAPLSTGFSATTIQLEKDLAAAKERKAKNNPAEVDYTAKAVAAAQTALDSHLAPSAAPTGPSMPSNDFSTLFSEKVKGITAKLNVVSTNTDMTVFFKATEDVNKILNKPNMDKLTSASTTVTSFFTEAKKLESALAERPADYAAPIAASFIANRVKSLTKSAEQAMLDFNATLNGLKGIDTGNTLKVVMGPMLNALGVKDATYNIVKGGVTMAVKIDISMDGKMLEKTMTGNMDSVIVKAFAGAVGADRVSATTTSGVGVTAAPPPAAGTAKVSPW